MAKKKVAKKVAKKPVAKKPAKKKKKYLKIVDELRFNNLLFFSF